MFAAVCRHAGTRYAAGGTASASHAADTGSKEGSHTIPVERGTSSHEPHAENSGLPGVQNRPSSPPVLETQQTASDPVRAQAPPLSAGSHV